MWTNPYTRTRNSLSVGVGKSFIANVGFTQDIDWKTGTVLKGGPQAFSGTPGAGNDFRQGGNFVVCYGPNSSGTLSAMSSTAFRRTDKGEMQYPSINTGLLWNRDFTNAVWVKDAGVTAAKNQTGADGGANAASSLTWTVDNAKCLQSFTSTIFDRALQCDIKRISGSDPLECTFDNGSTWQTVTVQGSSYDVMQPSVNFQAAVTNPVVGWRSKAGNTFAFDFALLIVPPTNWPSLAPIHARPITTSATVQTFIERAYASFPDSSPLATIARGPFAFYWQGRSSRQGGYPMTSASNLFLNVVSGTGAVVFKNGPSGATQTADGVWRFDNALTQVNKIAGWCNATNLRMACNGVLAGAATGTLGLDAALDHWDLGTNGSGANSIFGINERIAMGPGFSISDADLITMTT